MLVLALSGTAFAYYEHLNGNIHRVDVFGHITTPRPAPAPEGAENILVVGDDSRTGATPAELAQENTTTDGGSDNTDTIMVLHLAANGGPATLISFPRDSYVDIPGFGMDKLNAAYADGESASRGNGPTELTETVEQLSGLRIDHFISVGFAQFINISNAVGGVQVCISTSGGAHDAYSGTDLPRGVSTISGSQALAFVRQRHGLPQGDIDRIGRQQRFLEAVEKKAKTVRNPSTVNAVLEKATRSLTVDEGLSGIALLQLADRLESLPASDIHYVTVPISDIGATAYLHGETEDVVDLDTGALPAFFAGIQSPAAVASPTVSASSPAIASTSAAPTSAAPTAAPTSSSASTTDVDGVPCGP